MMDAQYPRIMTAVSYRNLLDRLKLFHVRAKFDIGALQQKQSIIGQSVPVQRKAIPPQVLICCHFCNSPISQEWANNKYLNVSSTPNTAMPITRLKVRCG